VTVSGGAARQVPARGPSVATWASRLVLGAAVWCLVSIVLASLSPLAARIGGLAFGVFNVPVAGNVFTAALLFVVAGALAVRKRAEMWFVILAVQVGWLVVAPSSPCRAPGTSGRCPTTASNRSSSSSRSSLLPTGGLRIPVDRLLVLLTGTTIRRRASGSSTVET
jgi:hypothetical protein